jgi:hypothetical protein
MRGANLRALLTAAALGLWIGPAQAGPPIPQVGPAANPTGVPRTEEPQSIGIDPHRTNFVGTVLTVSDRPIAGATVELFIDGERVAGATTAPDGSYEMRAHYDYNEDATAILWYTPPDRTLLPKALVLNESRASREYKVISPCIPRVKVTPGHQFKVYLFDPANRIKELEEAGCLP